MSGQCLSWKCQLGRNGEVSGTIRPGKCLSKQCPVGEMSGRGNVRLVSGRGSVQNYPAGGSVLREVPVEEASSWGNVKSGKCSVSVVVGKVSGRENVRLGKMSGQGYVLVPL